jgi:hypothetical protein
MVRAGVVALDTSWDTGVCLKPLAVRLNALCVGSQWQSRPLVRNKKCCRARRTYTASSQPAVAHMAQALFQQDMRQQTICLQHQHEVPP